MGGEELGAGGPESNSHQDGAAMLTLSSALHIRTLEAEKPTFPGLTITHPALPISAAPLGAGEAGGRWAPETNS